MSSLAATLADQVAPGAKRTRDRLHDMLTVAATGAGGVAGAGLGAGAGWASGLGIRAKGRRAMIHGNTNPIDAPLPHGRGRGTLNLLRKGLLSGTKAVSLRAVLGAALGMGAGGVGAYQLSKRKKTAMSDEGQAALAGTVLGAGAGAVGGAGSMLPTMGRWDKLHDRGMVRGARPPRVNMLDDLHRTIAHKFKTRAALGALLAAAVGGVGAHQLSKRKKTAMATKTSATRDDLLKILKGIGTATAGGAGAGALVGAGIGSVSGKPEGRSRLAQILRSALKGGAVGGGITAGALTGGLGAGKAMKGVGQGAGMSPATTNKLTAGATLGGALAGAGAGGALGAKLGAEKRAALAYILRQHVKQELLSSVKTALGRR